MVLRLYTRGLLTRAIGSEDWVLLAAVVSSTTLCGVIIYQVNKGLGLHSERVPMSDWVYLRLAGWLAILFNTISLHLTKISILLLYARVFTKRSYRIAIYIKDAEKVLAHAEIKAIVQKLVMFAEMKCSGGKAPCDRCRKANSYCVYEPPQAAPPNGNDVPVQPEIQPLIVCATAPIEAPPGSSKFSETGPTVNYSTACSQHASIDDANVNFQLPVSLPSFDYSGNELAPSQPNSSADFSRRKRRRISDWLDVDNLDDTDSETMVGDKDQDISQASSPYQTVKEFEAAYWRVNSLEGIIPRTPTSIELGKPFPPEAMFPSSMTDRGPLLYCLAEVGICEADAKDMFILFGERVASFMPGLYDTQFLDLPNDPLYALAAIKVMTRYLPSVDALRARVEVVLQSLLRNILFDDLQRPFAAVLESMRGLSILYGYSEVTVARSQSDTRQGRADALSIKGVIEGYAIRRNIAAGAATSAYGRALEAACNRLSMHALAPEHSMLPREWDNEREFDADTAGLIDIFAAAGAGTLQTTSAQQSDGPMSGFQTLSDLPVGDLLASLGMPWQ
ncbi:hypothetical protein HZS61_009102 [Fusarium oxysporum f. sp. conglutinans]|uniref:Rhodopsin domain-containing protein n=1 Tax=Fusarium oxysporum f. sp. conglutinans TaxID=100902 RepID=A0A8H6GX75_FUSOX|nr:hypothetical protein HZS61_009102 [Fusarium oxysporum f. sp. conglutinans]